MERNNSLRYIARIETQHTRQLAKAIMNLFPDSWWTCDDELINMYLDDDTTMIISVRTGLVTTYYWY